VKANSPQVGVGAVVFHQNRVLLIKRGQAPNKNQWAIPGGRIQLGETLQQAAEREILEETGIRIKAGKPVFSFDLIQHDDEQQCQWHYVVVDLDAEYLSGDPVAGDDAVEARWVSADELTELPVNETTLQLLKNHYQFA
jgi:ADP-ribose pyrophosphatase